MTARGSDDVTDLRRSLRAHREALTANTEALRRFNENIEDAIEAAQQLLPLAEGAAAGSSAIKTGLGIFQGILEARKSRRAP